jgi:16S rRNA (guanine966-N2)-methyltransferase
VREALFSMLGEITQARVLDLYAGSGALGIEALSRGAGSAVFVEREPGAAAAIRHNLEQIGAEARVRRQDALGFLSSADERFDLVFIDPPYDSAGRLGGSLSEALPNVLSDNARIVTESDKHAPLELELPLERERTYGDTRIAIHRA